MSQKIALLIALLWSGLYLTGCGGGSSNMQDFYLNNKSNASVFVAPRPSAIQKVAVLPFKAPTELIGSSVSDIFTMELLRSERYTLVERSQISGVLGETELSLSGISEEAAVAAGRMLGADGVILGTVDEYATAANDGYSYPVVGATIRMIDCVSAEVMWSVSHSNRSENSRATLSSHARAVILEMMVALVQNWKVQPKDPKAVSLPPPPPPPARAIAAPPVTKPVSAVKSLPAAPAIPPKPAAATAEKPAMLAPPDFSVSDLGMREVRLEWAPATTQLKYRIERATSENGPFAEIATVASGTGVFADRGGAGLPLKDATTYYYRIVAMDDVGRKSLPSPVQESMTSPPPDPPQNLQAQLTGHAVDLRWSAVETEGETQYLIERQKPQESAFTQVGTTEKISFQDTVSAGEQPESAAGYQYRVKAINRVGAIGEASAAARVKIAAVSVPSPAMMAPPAGTPEFSAKKPAPDTVMKPAAAQNLISPLPPSLGSGEGTSSHTIEEYDQQDGVKVKKITRTSASVQEDGGSQQVTTTEKTFSDHEGFVRKEQQVVTTTTAPAENGKKITTTITETNTLHKDGASSSEKQTHSTTHK